MRLGSLQISATHFVGLSGVISLAIAIPSWGDPPTNRQQLPSVPATVLISDDSGVQMRAKLSRSKDILAGLVRRDFDSISRAAKELKRISAATDWPYARDARFRKLNTEFQHQCDQLDALAVKLNYDGVQFTFQNMTVSCIACHDHVRDAKRDAEVGKEGETRLLRP